MVVGDDVNYAFGDGLVQSPFDSWYRWDSYLAKVPFTSFPTMQGDCGRGDSRLPPVFKPVGGGVILHLRVNPHPPH